MNFLLRLAVLSKRKNDPKPKPDWLGTDPGNYEYLEGRFNGLTALTLTEIISSNTAEQGNELLQGKFNGITKVDLIPA